MMGKTRKVTKGNLSQFVPDYRHAVGTMSELERMGSFRRVDTEMVASEGSSAPKRRVVSLNGDNYDRFGVPIEFFPVSQMARSERKYLEQRLNNELQQVRIFQRRVASMGSNYSEFRSLGGGIRTGALENLNRPLNEVAMVKGKEKTSQWRNGPRTKGAGARRSKSAKTGLPSSTTIFMLMKQCETLLHRLMSHAMARIFNAPVDIVELSIPDYFTIIKQPMDLGTIKSKLLSGQYSDPLGFAADVRLTFSNAMTYNPPGNEVHIMAKTMSKIFEVRWKPIEKKLSMMADFPLPIESETATTEPPTKKKVGIVEHEVKQNYVKRVMTLNEKQKLSVELEAVAAELPDSIIDFLKGNTNNSSETNDGEIEIDLESLTDETLFTLRDLLNNYRSNKQKSVGRVEPCEIELHNDSGFSNSSVQPFRGNDLADEDVDIGGKDAPISRYSPVEIEKNGAGQDNKYSSSSSSSSDSGSSSSDSDTRSASHGDSDGLKNQAQINCEKESCSSEEKLEQKGGYVGANAADVEAILSGDIQLNSKLNFDSGSSSGCQEGGGDIPPERQVSPGKNYRAALLRERFADTILKALEKDEKMDLDRLKLEREEFERKKKEDKARLLAEARAAEVAQREVEAEAEAEAKRKRELEREAARQALQKMEKTVDINENTLFLEDLEMLSSAPEPSLLGVPSPDDDQNALGSFNLQASGNPLEHLGLYMKDDDEEEEGDPQHIKDMSHASEKGNID
ncbi:DNA-binding transcription factor [Lithospermum erythrorhizon]|uniref:DNA-binding transcription factor n=1 Tax=Lithospermum erythrorhizon TaxID=34254 RepID=A0AAV3NJ51_LITER